MLSVAAMPLAAGADATTAAVAAAAGVASTRLIALKSERESETAILTFS